MNPLLAALLQRAQTPLVPESAIQPTVQSLTEPKLDQSPMLARIKGFGAGALEGLRGQTSPLNLAGIATLLMGTGALRGAATAAGEASEIVPEVVQAGRAVRQVMPEADDVTRLVAQLKDRLMQVPSAGSKTLGQVAPEYTAVGGESALNATRAGMKQIKSPIGAQEAMYRRIMSSGRGNMGSLASEAGEAGEVNPNLVIGGGAALGGALLAKKLYDAVKGVGDQIQSVNPLKKASDILDSAAGKRGKY